MTDFSKTLIRCHALGQIMTNNRGKTNLEKYLDASEKLEDIKVKYDALKNKEGKMGIGYVEKRKELEQSLPGLEAVKDEEILSDTCKTYLIQAYVLSKYGRVREITTKMMVKGTISEEDAIDLFSIFDRKIYNKNTDRLSNEYISGTPDIYDGETILDSNEIIDIKCSWDIFTFLSNVDKLQDVENDASVSYYWQLQGYMALTGAKIGTLAYCLVDTPDSIIEGEKYNLLRKMDVATEEDAEYKREVVKLMQNRKFTDIPMNERCLTYSVDRNDDDISRIYKRVVKCREFIAEFEEMHLQFSKKYRKTLQLQ